ncbi:MAG: DUF1700 domain-containing protein [Clostridia bacterium]|nr:DUF1700 domain-containing protein [Clostridia bacterium]
MTKQAFLDALKKRLRGLPKQDVEERLGFYSEMIDDRIEEGLTEEEAVSQLGSVEEVASQIIADIPLVKIVKEKIKVPRQIKGWEIVLLILGFPLWFPLLIAAFSVAVSLVAVLFSLVVVVWAVFASLVAMAGGGVVGGIILACTGNPLTGLLMIGAGVFCAGLSILTFYGALEATKGMGLFVKKSVLAVKKLFVKEAE